MINRMPRPVVRARAPRKSRSRRLRAKRPTTADERFRLFVDLLRTFATREGHAIVPSDRVEAGFPLGRWVAQARRDYRRGELAPSRARALARVSGWAWDVRQHEFERGLDALRRFARRE